MNTLTKIIQKMLGQTPTKKKTKIHYSKKRIKLKELKAIAGTMEDIRGKEIYIMENCNRHLSK